MADFLSILGFLAFTAAMLGLIKVLDKVWVFLKSFFSSSRWSCSCTSATPCSNPRSS